MGEIKKILPRHRAEKENLLYIRKPRERFTTLKYKYALIDINTNITVLGEYINAKTKIKHSCDICGYIWYSLADNILRGHGCPKCNGHYTMTHEEFMYRVKDKVNENVVIIGKYVDSNTKIRCECKLCENEWETIPYSLLNGSGCRKCADKELSKKNLKTKDKFIKQIKQINSDIIILGDYTGANNNITCKCKICNHIWDPTPASLLHGTGCPKCSSSHGEKSIHTFLINNTIAFESQKRFNDLRGVGGKPLSYDFYIPQYNLLIEFQGEQHVNAREYFGGEEKLKIQQEHDNRKREFAKQNNINLLEIWYYDIDNIESILLEKLIK